MKRLLIAVAVLFLVTLPVFAQGLTYFPNETSQITLYDWGTHELKVGIRYPALNWNRILFLDGALVTEFATLSIAGGLSVELTALGKKLGLNVTLAENVIFGWLTGYNFREEKVLYGIYSGVKWKW